MSPCNLCSCGFFLGEPEFIERMSLEYHDIAVKAGVTVLHAAVGSPVLVHTYTPKLVTPFLSFVWQAFDSVPCDLGVLEMKRALVERGATPSSIEVFFRVNTESSFASEFAFYLLHFLRSTLTPQSDLLSIS